MRRFALAIVAASGVAVASASVATAADIPVKARPAPSPVWTWTGFYIGAHVGSAWGTIESEVPGGGFSFASGAINGFLGGGQAGYNWQTGVIVVGVEADASATSLKGTTPCIIGVAVCERKVDWMSTFTGRVGFTADRALIYVKGGGAWANFKYTTSAFGLGVASAEKGQWGATIGAGVEYAFAPGWSAKIEYDFMDFGKHTVAFANVGGGVTNVDVTQFVHAVKFGVNYKLGGGPIYAAY